MSTPLSQTGEMFYKSSPAVSSGPACITVSTQTPPEFAPPDDEPSLGMERFYQAAYDGGVIFLFFAT